MKLIFTRMLITAVFVANIAIIHAQKANIADSLALVDLYDSTDGPHWINNANWLVKPVKNWYGITLDNNGNIKGINLAGNNLKGKVPASIANFSKLQALTLQNNFLIFDGLELVAQKFSFAVYAPQHTRLQVNYKAGVFCVSAGGTLADNTYSWYSLKGQETVVTGDSTYSPFLFTSNYYVTVTNKLANKLTLYSDTFGIASKTNKQDSLALVDLYNSTGGNHWKNNTGWLNRPVKNWYGVGLDTNGRVIYVILNNNGLKGLFQPSLGDLSKLQYLALSSNQLTGSIPSSIGNITTLYDLELQNNHLSGTLSSSLLNLPQLRFLQLEHNFFTFDGLETLSEKLPNATYNPQDTVLPIHYKNGILSVSAGGSVANNTYHWYHNVNGVSHESIISGDSTYSPTDGGNYFVYIRNNKATTLQLTSDTINVQYADADKQDSAALVDLYNNTDGLHWKNNIGWLAGPVKGWYGIKINVNGRVISINLHSNNLTGKLPASIGGMVKLDSLNLASNALSSSIPTALGNLTSLRFLNLSYNFFTDSIPSSLGNLINLQYLYLSYNYRLGGKIPSQLGNLSRLAYLDLSHNALSGEVPSTLGSHIKAQYIYLDDNYFTFSGMEAFAQKLGWAKYAPQHNITLKFNKNILYAPAGGTVGNNTYYWYKGDTLVATIKGDSTYKLSGGGYYRVVVKNKIATALTLNSDSLLTLFITSFTPKSGTYLTKVTITGSGFSYVDPEYYGVTFGGQQSDSAAVISDTKIVAWVGSGASGPVRVNSTPSLDSFVYIPVKKPADIGWQYAGPVKASTNKANFVSGTCGRDNLPIVAYVDSASKRAVVLKLTTKNTFKQLGAAVSDGACSSVNLVLDTFNNPVIAYIDALHNNGITVKQFSNGNWQVLGTEGFVQPGKGLVPFSMAIDNDNLLYILSSAGGYPFLLNLYKFDGTSWIKVGKDDFARSGDGDFAVAINPVTNSPYVAFDDYSQISTLNYQSYGSVMNFERGVWAYVGLPGFANAPRGVYYTDLKFDSNGNPLTSFQDDNGFERASAYKFSNGSWGPVGYRYFSKGHAYYPYMAVDKKSTPFVIFKDISYNNQGTVMTVNNKTGRWQVLGGQGIFNASYFGRNAIFTDNNNTTWVAFSNNDVGGSVSLMKYVGPAQPTILPANPDSLYANREMTDTSGWTHYYYDNNTPTIYDDDTLLLSLKKNGQDIGAIGDGVFSVKLVATAKAGSNSATMLSNPLITNTSGYWVMNRYWQVTATKEPKNSVGVRFYYNNQDLNDINGSYPTHNLTNNKLIFYKAVGGNPNPTSNLSGAKNIISILNGALPSDTTWVYNRLTDTTQYAEYSVASFSGGGGGGTGNNKALPVTLLSFTGNRIKTDVQLSWQTVNEFNADNYFVERSLDGVDFTAIASVHAKGNPSTDQSYGYTDFTAASLNANLVYYRLRIVDKNGDFSYSKTISLQNDGINKPLVLYPNPAQTSAELQFVAVTAKKYTVNIATADGKVLKRINISASEGSNRIVIDVRSFPPAIYTITLISDKDNKTLKLVKK
ncbi:MAG TPA: IPT/TIG domain-containing protein [Chitinophagaceae bacterium]|nr:IPT/TIG domain-containing protein [Chitinophagaceae bacterium]